jgi:SAM-dependent MidA family methyltransferase
MPVLNAPLVQLILQRIQAAPAERICFAEFMEMALHHPQYGYYARQDAIIGPDGDFVTAPHLGHDFGELLAVQLGEIWQRLGEPHPFQVVEMGAGQGLVAADILRYLRSHPCFTALEYTIVEQSPTLRAWQQEQLAPWQAKLSWSTLAAIAPASVVGCVFSNELIDAFPVHIVERQGTQLQEVYVTRAHPEASPDASVDASVEHPPFLETRGPLSTPRLAAYFDWLGLDLCSDAYPDGYRTEVNLVALDWLTAIAARLRRGYLLTIDYGYAAHRYYSPSRRQGTLQCYSRHRHHSDPYAGVGNQDITAHVNFTALENQGERIGLQTVGFTQQALFLMALGLGDRIAALSQLNGSQSDAVQQALQRRQALHQLINPLGLGNFGVLVQSKGLIGQPPLTGLRSPT